MVYKSDEQIVIQAPADLKEALGEYAAANNLPMSEVIRQAIAERIGFNYERAPRTRYAKYDSEEERKTAQYGRAALKRWGYSEGARRLDAGEIELATMIARAVAQNDYDGLEALRSEIEKDDEDDVED